MRILFVFGFTPKTGGHFKSALAMIKYLSCRENEIYAMAPNWAEGVEETSNAFRAAGATNISVPHFFSCRNPFLIVFGSFRIMRECKKQRIDVIHAQEFQSIAPSFLAAVLLRKGFVYTKAGGPVFERVLPPRNVETVFYSQELVDGMLRKYNIRKDNISLIAARIDLNCYRKIQVSSTFKKKYCLPTSRKRMVMAMRMTEEKRPWLEGILNLAMQMKRENICCDIVIAGDGPLLPYFSGKADRINKRDPNGRFIHFIGPVLDIEEMNQLYNYADMAIGHGRGILEAMACGKAVVVLGENGGADIVNSRNINEIAEFNFSGRHLRFKSISAAQSVSSIRAVLENDDVLKDLGVFSYQYVKDHMDADIGAIQLYSVYKKAFLRVNSLKDYIKWYIDVNYSLIRKSVIHRLGIRI
jgi:glycosyltransferase involved in cell wall biosynthesis